MACRDIARKRNPELRICTVRDIAVSHDGFLAANPEMDGRTPRRRRAGRTSGEGAVSASGGTWLRWERMPALAAWCRLLRAGEGKRRPDALPRTHRRRPAHGQARPLGGAARFAGDRDEGRGAVGACAARLADPAGTVAARGAVRRWPGCRSRRRQGPRRRGATGECRPAIRMVQRAHRRACGEDVGPDAVWAASTVGRRLMQRGRNARQPHSVAETRAVVSGPDAAHSQRFQARSTMPVA